MYKDRIVGLERVPVAQLEEHPQNWRKHPEEQQSAMAGALEEIGWSDALVVRATDGGKYEILDGHLRAKQANGEQVPCLVVDLDGDEAAKFVATHDPLGVMAETDSEMLAGLMESVDFENDDLLSLVDSFAGISDIIGVDKDLLGVRDNNNMGRLSGSLKDRDQVRLQWGDIGCLLPIELHDRVVEYMDEHPDVDRTEYMTQIIEEGLCSLSES